MARKQKLNMVQQIFAETVVYGGLIATRAEVYEDIVSLNGNSTMADYISMRAKEATPEDIANRPRLADIRAAGF
jgi:hypothetical protein